MTISIATALSNNCKNIRILSGSGLFKSTGRYSLNEGEEYVTHQIEQTPPGAYQVTLHSVKGNTTCRNETVDAVTLWAGTQFQLGGTSAGLSLGMGANKNTSKISSLSVQTKDRVVEITVEGGTSSCCGFGKESVFTLMLVIKQP